MYFEARAFFKILASEDFRHLFYIKCMAENGPILLNVELQKISDRIAEKEQRTRLLRYSQ